MSGRKSPSLIDSNPFPSRSSRPRIPASGFEGRHYAARTEDGRFQPRQSSRLKNMLTKIRKTRGYCQKFYEGK